MHLYDETLDPYLARKLPQMTLSALDAHVSNCLFCAHVLADQQALAASWERRGWLGRLVRVDEAPAVTERVEAARAEAA
jgi:hypothetical protein